MTLPQLTNGEIEAQPYVKDTQSGRFYIAIGDRYNSMLHDVEDPWGKPPLTVHTVALLREDRFRFVGATDV